jgi:hypothetical protein
LYLVVLVPAIVVCLAKVGNGDLLGALVEFRQAPDNFRGKF